MNRVMAVVVAVAAIVAASLTPVAQAAPDAPVVAPTSSGADCSWGTGPAQAIPHVDYPRGYLFGGDWRRDNQPTADCAIGPAWTPLMHQYPHSKVLVNSEMYGSVTAASHLCTGIADPTCAPSEWPEIYAESTLGYCRVASDFNCVESLQVIDPNGAVAEARYLRGFPEVPGTAEFNQDGIFMPAGGSVPLWEYAVSGGTARILTVGMSHTVFRSSNGRWNPAGPAALFTFNLRPVTIESRPGIPKPQVIEQVDPQHDVTKVAETGWSHPSAVGCAAIEQGECAIDAAFPADYRYRVTLRMRDAASMYLNGAVDEPVAYSEKIEGGHRFVIEASPSPVIGMAGWIPKSQIPRSLVDKVFSDLGFNYNWEIDVDAASYKSLGRGGAQSLAWLKALMPFFGDRASFIVDAWYVENTPTLGRYTSQCVNQGRGEFIGIVSSNATAYTGDPPTYDPATSTLKYEVAGPHFMPDGTTLSRGRYSINMNAEFVKCLLGVDTVPTSARVELIYPDGEGSAATLAVKQDRNWLRLSYENFTFSNPTVSVKFPQTLTCMKGKGKKAQVKQFVAFSCPKGWRPKP